MRINGQEQVGDRSEWIAGVVFAQRHRFFMWAPVCFAFGIAIFFSLKGEPPVWICFTVGLVSLTMLAIRRFFPDVLTVVALVPVLVSAGFITAVVRANLVAAPKLGWHYYGPVEGTIAHLDRSASNTVRVTLSAPVLNKLEPSQTPKFVRVSLHSKLPGTGLIPGGRIMVTASLSPPAGPVEPGGFDFQRRAWFDELGGVGYARAPPVLADSARAEGFSIWLFDLRMRVSSAIRREISGQRGAFAAAIVTGDRSAIDPAKMTHLRQSNLAHLLAISGLHMGLLTGFVFAVIRLAIAAVPFLAVRAPSKKIAAVIALMAGLAYLGVSGANVATQRAYVMVAVMLVAVLLNRPAITLRAVALAAFLILILRPESLIEPGFQMSFAATTALVATFEALNKMPLWHAVQNGQWRFLQPVFALVVSSGIAGLATAPISAFHFNQIAQYGLMANLLSVPLMGAIIMPAAVVAGGLSLIGLHSIALTVMGWGIGWIMGVAAWVSGLDGAVMRIPTAPTQILALFAMGALILVLWHGRARFCGVIVILMSFWFWTQVNRPDVLITDNGRLVGIMEQGHRSLNRDKGSGFAASVWLENDGEIPSQKIGAGRWNLGKDAWVWQEDGPSVGYLWNKKANETAINGLCSKVDILIAPNWKQPVNGTCVMVGNRALRKNGSVALWKEGGVWKLKSARHLSGTRLWNEKDQ